MAEKRMFTQKIIDSDAFLDMPLSAQTLYFHLNMRADDDGFVNNPKKIQRMIGASVDDLKILLMKRFIIGFDSGVIVIKHWRMHNTIKNDRYHPTDYQEEFAMLGIKENKAYTEKPGNIPLFKSKAEPKRNQHGAKAEPQNRLGLDKIRLDKINPPPSSNTRTREEENLGKVMSFVMDRLNPTPSPLMVADVKHYLETLDPDVIIHAVSIAIDEKKTSWSYIKAILQRYARDGKTTMLDVNDDETKRQQKKEGEKQDGKHRGDPESDAEADARWGIVYTA